MLDLQNRFQHLYFSISSFTAGLMNIGMARVRCTFGNKIFLFLGYTQRCILAI